MGENKQAFTIEFVAKLLLDKGLISEDQYKDITIKGNAQRARLQKYQETSHSRRGMHSHENVSPAEVISSFNIEIPGKNGKLLTEDAITTAVAEVVGIKYMKIDPLKLNLETITSYVSRPFAQKYLMIPVSEESGVVTIAVADPFDLAAV